MTTRTSRSSSSTTTARRSAKATLQERLAGSKAFSLGPYKTSHVAHSFASQVRRMIREGSFATAWEVVTNTEKNTIRVSPPRG